MKKNYRRYNAVILFICIVMVSFSVFAAPQETTSGYVAPPEIVEFSDGSEYAMNPDLFAEENYLGVLETFIYDMDCHPDIPVDAFLSAKIGKPFQFPKADSDGNIFISDESMFYIPVINGSDVLAMIMGSTDENGDHVYSITSGYSKGYSKGINALLADTRADESILLFFTYELGLIGSNGRTTISLVTTEPIRLDTELGATDESNNRKGAPAVTVGAILDNLRSSSLAVPIDVLAQREDIRQDQTVSQLIADFNETRARDQVRATEITLPNYPIFTQTGNTCWAGTLASMIKYELPNDYPNISVYTVAGYVGYGAGTWTNVMSVFNGFFPSPPYLPTQVSYLSRSAIKTVIGNNDPAYVQGKLIGGASAHAVALNGYREDGSAFEFRYMNPGTGLNEWGIKSYSYSGPYSFTYGSRIWEWENTVRLYYI